MWGNKQLLYETFYLIQKLIDLMSCFFLEKFLVHRTLHVGYSMWPLIPPSDFYHSLLWNSHVKMEIRRFPYQQRLDSDSPHCAYIFFYITIIFSHFCHGFSFFNFDEESF